MLRRISVRMGPAAEAQGPCDSMPHPVAARAVSMSPRSRRGGDQARCRIERAAVLQRLDQRQRETYDGMMYDLIRKLRRKP